MVSCGCGITMKNAQEAAQHTEVCSEPKIDLGEVQQRLDTGLDYPRHQVKTREAERYLAHRRYLYSLVFSEGPAEREAAAAV